MKYVVNIDELRHFATRIENGSLEHRDDRRDCARSITTACAAIESNLAGCWSIDANFIQKGTVAVDGDICRVTMWLPREMMGRTVYLYGHKIAHENEKIVLPEALPDLDPATLHRDGKSASDYQIGYHDGWNGCREAMLAAPHHPTTEKGCE